MLSTLVFLTCVVIALNISLNPPRHKSDKETENKSPLVGLKLTINVIVLHTVSSVLSGLVILSLVSFHFCCTLWFPKRNSMAFLSIYVNFHWMQTYYLSTKNIFRILSVSVKRKSKVQQKRLMEKVQLQKCSGRWESRIKTYNSLLVCSEHFQRNWDKNSKFQVLLFFVCG